jgi:hypothetical protein
MSIGQLICLSLYILVLPNFHSVSAAALIPPADAAIHTAVSSTTRTIAFSSAVAIEASVSRQLQQQTSVPAIPIPKNATDIPAYSAVGQLAFAGPPVHTGIGFPITEELVQDLISWTNISSTGSSLSKRAGTLRVMIVGDSMTLGQQGDWTWRYRIWQWFQQNDIAVQFVGPYKGTVQPDPPTAPQPPSLQSSNGGATPPKTDGGYAKGVDNAFLSNCYHFAAWGRAAAVDKGLIQDVVQNNQADLMLVMLGFNDMGWYYSDADGTLDSISTLITNARAANPNLKFAVANVPHRKFIGGREDLVCYYSVLLLPLGI